MKKLGLELGMIVFTLSANAQVLTYNEVSSSNKKQKAITTYVTSAGDSISVGSIVKIAVPKEDKSKFNYIYSSGGYATQTYNNSTAEVIEIKMYGSRSIGFRIQVHMKSKTSKTLVADYEAALLSGEIVTDTLNREQAIYKLKESKDLFDLGLMNEEEYNLIKEELTPIIMGN